MIKFIAFNITKIVSKTVLPTTLQKITEKLPQTWQEKLKKLELYPITMKNFRFNVFARICGISLTIFNFTYLISRDGYGFTSFAFLVLILAQIYSLIRHVENTNREVVNFLNSIQYDDFSNSYKLSIEGESFKALNEAFNNVLEKFREIRAEKEAHHQYLKTIIHHIGIGIISFDIHGNVQIINSSAKKLFNINQLTHIDKLQQFSPELVDKIKKLRTGNKDLVKISSEEEIAQLAIYAIELNLQGESFKLITIQNIHAELEEKELDSWQKLIRVLTHEIMNSVAPISSLAATVNSELECLQEKEENSEDIIWYDLEDIHLATKTIQRRSEGLIRFVSDFRNLTHIPLPKFKAVKVQELFDHIATLMQTDIEDGNIRFNLCVEPSSLILMADQEMLEQVLINLIKNAIQALNECEEKADPYIILLAKQDEKNRPIISVKDNAGGIETEALEKIFIPFYTTKKSGSGIGLSLSQQIIRQHKGVILANSEIGKGTEFVIKF
jgi:two-component system nitrogen regulation sensor histidine kinase NtrY